MATAFLLKANGHRAVDGRDGTIASLFPIKVDIDGKVYGHIGNVTCAAAAATSKRMCTVKGIKGFITKLEKLKSFVII